MSESNSTQKHEQESKAFSQMDQEGRSYNIATLRSGRFDYQSPETVHIADIARSLSAHPRYLGHTNEPFSVAQHSVAVSVQVEVWNGSEEDQLLGLMHDAAEAYCGDLPRPLRDKLNDRGGAYDSVMEEVEQVIGRAFDIPAQKTKIVDQADSRVYGLERQGVSEHRDIDVSEVKPAHPKVAKVLSGYWTPAQARQRFLDRFAQFRTLPNSIPYYDR